MPEVAWIAADWGTTHLRVWAMNAGNAVIANEVSEDGMGTLSHGAFESALLSLIGNWLSEGRVTPVIACGMVGARQGWIEAPYRAVPVAMPSPEALTSPPTSDPRIDVFIIPGLMQSDPPDVMRGEETQIAGLLSERPEFDGIVGMPGTHTKWTRVSDGEVRWFSSHMTGELFALLRNQSVLRHSVGGDGFDGDAFVTTVQRKTGSLTELFSIRADDLLRDVPAATSVARLSGALIGSEIDAIRPKLDGAEVVVLGNDDLAGLYTIALDARGISAERVDGSAMTLNGLIAAKTAWEATA